MSWIVIAILLVVFWAAGVCMGMPVEQKPKPEPQKFSVRGVLRDMGRSVLGGLIR